MFERLVGAIPRPQNDARYAPGRAAGSAITFEGHRARGHGCVETAGGGARAAASARRHEARPRHRLDRQAFRRAARRKGPAGLRVVGVPTSEATRAQAEQLRRAADDAGRDRPPRSHRRRRRRDRRRAQSHQGRRRRAAAGKDRGGGLRSHDRDRRREQMGRCARPLSAAGRGDPVRSRRDPSRHGRRVCGKRRFRANGGPERQGRPRFCHRWRPLDHRCPSRANQRCAASGRLVEPDPRRGRARLVHRPCRRGGAGGRAGNSHDRTA